MNYLFQLTHPLFNFWLEDCQSFHCLDDGVYLLLQQVSIKDTMVNMKIIKSEEREWSQKEGYSKKIYLTGDDLNCKGALVQKLKIKPGEKAGLHHHKKQTEIFYFLNDVGYWMINGKKVIVEADDVLVIEPGDKHIAVNESDQDFLYMAFKMNYQEDDIVWD